MDAINENIANKKTQKLKEQQDWAREKEVAAEIKAQRLRDNAICLAGFQAQRQAEALEQSENPNLIPVEERVQSRQELLSAKKQKT